MMDMILQYGPHYMICINAIALAFYGLDKRKAQAHAYRIPEAHMLLVAAAGGAFGALVGMIVFHHKTQKPLFQILVPVFAGVWIALIWLVLHR